jgi:hypothetical protein
MYVPEVMFIEEKTSEAGSLKGSTECALQDT